MYAIRSYYGNPAQKVRVGDEGVLCVVEESDLRHAREYNGVTGPYMFQGMIMTLPEQTIAALEKWIVHRGKESGPLFISLAPTFV